MTDNTPERTEPAPAPPYPSAPPGPPLDILASPKTAPLRRPGKGALIAAAAVVVLLAGGGLAWWALAGDGDPIDHVEVSGGKLTSDDNEDCDDTDEFTYNDCDSYSESDDTVYEFDYKITNKGDEPANYSVIVNAFDEDGDFVSQTYIGSVHLAAGKTDSDESEFDEYATLEDGHELSDIESVKVAWVERMALAN
ncbi:hypothetical protein [Streptomyces sp. NPDC058739]|uniref:hypothetical protein n=1 Tax=Streptomyces sp. NPDC058739 TaxID=3346618 RepID=UPI00367D5E28